LNKVLQEALHYDHFRTTFSLAEARRAKLGLKQVVLAEAIQSFEA